MFSLFDEAADHIQLKGWESLSELPNALLQKDVRHLNDQKKSHQSFAPFIPKSKRGGGLAPQQQAIFVAVHLHAFALRPAVTLFTLLAWIDDTKSGLACQGNFITGDFITTCCIGMGFAH